MTPLTRRLAAGVALVLGVSACGPVRQAARQESYPAAEPASSGPAPAVSTPAGGASAADGGGVSTGPVSTALRVEGRNMRLTRVGDRELALQFDLYNGTDEDISPGELGLEGRERLLALIDPQKGAAYGLMGADRISEDADIEPGGTARVTAVFAAPPGDTSELLVALNGLLPVMVPIGSGTPEDDPALRGPHAEGSTGALVCKVSEGGNETFRLPSDVLFAFGSARLSPAATSAIAALGARVAAGSGTVTVEGHTDAVGGDAANQTLSEQRAEAVARELRPVLGDGFTYQAAGHGERKPVAPTPRPAGATTRRAGPRTGAWRSASTVAPVNRPRCPPPGTSCPACGPRWSPCAACRATCWHR
ncbi:OmpA family protein [Nonomuraea typhae]|uniref:OmpA family protein n=1 Tax=Nonomuraea typhae TaxID=2603600 RepID=UPI0012F92B7B|nr:OmpA family protein [Nonomuraea typhae]